MNWAIPCAPTADTARGFHALSVWTCAAITGAGISGHITPARATNPTYAAGTVPARSRPPPGPVGSPPAGSAALVPAPPPNRTARSPPRTRLGSSPTRGGRIGG